MTTTVQTTFRNMDPSEAVTTRIQKEADKLHTFFDRIASCRVIVEAPHRHQRRGGAFHVRIEVGVPGKELVAGHDPAAQRDATEGRHKSQEVHGPHKDVYVTIRDGFKAMQRQLKDYVHWLRHEVKTHETAA
jgi:ribosome-associated translation inhibitor RaiA